MAPSGRRTTTSTKTATKTTKAATKTRRTRRHLPRRTTHFKKQQQHDALPCSSQDSTKELGGNDSIAPEVIDDDDVVVVSNDNISNSACSTPKGNKFRIPEISTCPPAPKKPRVLSSNCSLRRSPLSFFSPPDLELFFFVALRDVSV